MSEYTDEAIVVEVEIFDASGKKLDTQKDAQGVEDVFEDAANELLDWARVKYPNAAAVTLKVGPDKH
jgi:hypothetical protein